MNRTTRSLWRFVRWPLALYLIVLVMFSALQRSLMYFPTRESTLAANTVDLPRGQVHDLVVPTSDGLKLHGWHFLPDGQTAQDDAECDQQLKSCERLVLYFSGNGANRRARVDQCDLLAQCGCHVFLIDYRGYGDNDGSPSEEGLAEDARSIWKYAAETRGVPAPRIILFGESMGGGVAVRLAESLCSQGTPPGGVVLRGTFSSLVEVAALHYPWLPVNLALKDRFESIRHIAGVTCPLLQLHGDQDTIVPAAIGRKLFETAPVTSHNGVPKRWVTLHGADHNDILVVAARPLRQAFREFLTTLEHEGPTAKQLTEQHNRGRI